MYFSKKFPCEHLVLERCLWVWQVLERWYHWHESHHWQSLRDWSRWSEESEEEEWFCWESLSSDSSQHPQHHWLSRDPWLVWRILRSLEEQTTGENHLKHEDIINYVHQDYNSLTRGQHFNVGNWQWTEGPRINWSKVLMKRLKWV